VTTGASCRTEGRIFSECEWRLLSDDLGFSPRQVQIVRCLFDGLSDKQVAAETRVSVPTVRTHLTRLFTRLNVQDRNELILYVFRRFRRRCIKSECPRCRRQSALAGGE